MDQSLRQDTVAVVVLALEPAVSYSILLISFLKCITVPSCIFQPFQDLLNKHQRFSTWESVGEKFSLQNYIQFSEETKTGKVVIFVPFYLQFAR